MTNIIGISGKIGSGKNYLADKLMEKLAEQGFKVGFSSFAAPLKQELGSIIIDFQDKRKSSSISLKALDELSVSYSIPVTQLTELFDMIIDDMIENSGLTGYSRSEGVRRGLQYLGTEIRRAVDNDYWTRLFHETIDRSNDYVFATDARFPNEADSIRETQGVIIRVQPSPEVIAERTSGRDGIVYSEEALNHVSEVALDNYENFDIIIGDSFEAQDVLNNVESIIKTRTL